MLADVLGVSASGAEGLVAAAKTAYHMDSKLRAEAVAAAEKAKGESDEF